MTQTQQQAMMLGGLVVVCAVIYLRPRTRSTAPPPPSVPQTMAADSSPAAAVSPHELLQRRQHQRQRAELIAWDRDPFLPGGSQSTSGLSLSGIIWDATHPMAMINGTPVAVGDDVEGFRVQGITRDVVTLSDGAKTYQLRLNP